MILFKTEFAELQFKHKKNVHLKNMIINAYADNHELHIYIYIIQI
jgi:hypothetical protein